MRIFYLVTIFITGLWATNCHAQEQQEYIIKYKEGMKANVMNQLQRNQVNIRLSVDAGNLVAVKMPVSIMNGLVNHPAIEYIETDNKGELQSQITPYANVLIQANLLSDTNASNMKICVIDTGVQTSHEDIDGTLITGASSAGSGLVWNQPDNMHGTYMAGAIVAQNNGLGVQGALPNGYVRLHAFRIDNSSISTSSIVDGIYNCRDNGSNIISMSLNVSKSRSLQNAIQDVTQNDNMMVIASSGNDGSSRTKNYPASYAEVISVGAVDRFEQLALYSNTGSLVEFVAAGDAVLGTTLMGAGQQATLSIAGDSSYEAVAIYGSVTGNVSGNLVDCGDMSNSCSNASGNLCLIQAVKNNQNTDSQGNFKVNQQLHDCEMAGGIGAVFYGDVTEVQYSGYVDDNLIAIPAVSISDAEMTIAYNQLGSMSSLSLLTSNYTRSFGTSISSPYVASAAALVWSHHPNCSAEEIRQSLALTAKDLGVAGKDSSYGNGLPQALDAKLHLDANPCGGVENMAPTAVYNFQCNLLTCDFDGINSSDADGTVTSYAWDFGDGSNAFGTNASHTYSNSGSYTVTLTVTDDQGATGEYASMVSVSNLPIQLTINGYKVKGKNYTDLMWVGATTTLVDIYRNGDLITTVYNSGTHTDFVGQRGQFDYQICEVQSAVCSSIQTVNF